MAFAYRSVDRDQLFLLPPDMRDWLPEGHLVWFVLDVVERVDTSVLHDRHPNVGVGRQAYDPDMMLALLIYAYCTGIRSSRQIERLCAVDVAFRVLCANDAPDHTTIARFRQDHQAQAVRLFTDVLVLCQAAGLASVGVVAVDGTKIGANAALRANRTREQIEAEVAKMMADAEQTDREEDDLFGGGRGDELPEELADPRKRKVRLDAALREVRRVEAARRAEQQAAAQARAKAEAEAVSRGELMRGKAPAGCEVARAEAALALKRQRARARRADIEARAAARGRRPTGPPPRQGRRVANAGERLRQARQMADERAARGGTTSNTSGGGSSVPAGGDDAGVSDDDKAPKVNVTDRDSRIMHTAKGYIQGYNAQAVVNQNGVVLAASVTQDANDLQQCEPMIAALANNMKAANIDEPVGIMLFDAGYLSEQNLAADGPDRLIATGKAWKLRREEPTSGPPPHDASPIEAMDHRLRTPAGAKLYSQRQHTIEPVFGDIKENRGYRRFVQRGLAATRAEWQLITTAHNLRKLFDHRFAEQPG